MSSETVTADTADEGPGRNGRGLKAASLCLSLESERPLAAPSRHLLARVDAVALGRARDERRVERLTAGQRVLSILVPDRWMSSAHASMTRVLGKWVLEDLGSKNHTFVNGKQVARAELEDGDVIELGHTFFVFRDARPVEDDEPLDAPSRAGAEPGLTTLQSELTLQLRDLEKIAPTKVSVMLSGESGTGKEVLARAVHGLSGRGGAFVAINCGELPDNLLGSELFGYVKGAFTGALENRPGLVRTADQGTLFLDEIGDLPMSQQTHLLRVLQESEVRPVGAPKPVPVDLRVITATHRDLDAMAVKGDFRRDLLARLSGLPIELPPLRERREDVGLLVASLLRKLLGERAQGITFSVQAARALFLHDWRDQNVRGLEKTLGVAAALAGNGRIELDHLPIKPPPSPKPESTLPPREWPPADAARRAQIDALLIKHKGNITDVAEEMGKARSQLQRWMRRYRLDRTKYV